MHRISLPSHRVLIVAAVAFLIWLSLYVGLYLYLRDRGIREMNPYDSEGILYDSIDKIVKTHDLRTHEFRTWVFASINFLDQILLGGPEPVSCMMFDLS